MSQATLLDFPEYECTNESDVEQKFVYPLLVHRSFLRIRPKNILTKRYLGSLAFVEKSTLPKNYVPDYLLVYSGLPIVIIEAKSPDVDIIKALGETRLYAQVLNNNLPSGFNPVGIVAACNGIEFAWGPADANVSEQKLVSDIILGSQALIDLTETLGAASLEDRAEKLKLSRSTSQFATAAKRLDENEFVERVKQNALAPYLNPLTEMFFRAEEPEKIDLILERAYVDTAEMRQYDNVLHSVLKSIERQYSSTTSTIQTDKSREYTLHPEIERYQGDMASHGRLALIIGSRGSGKSLFVARFFRHLLSPTLREKSAWCVVDFNHAPSDIVDVESYICDKLLDDVQNLGFDPYDLSGLKRVFSVELARLFRGPLSLIPDEAERDRELYRELMKLSSDKRQFALCLARHITGDSGRPLIVAFDNVDRRESTQQLRIFQAAQWFRSETRAFALLTLRGTTFERFKGEPPLDAFAQLNNYYIRPPRFSLVLDKRLTLAIEEGLKDIDKIVQHSARGARLVYSKGQLGKFLKEIYKAIFVDEGQVGRILDALAERDVREALGMFARILSSGHFNPDQVIAIGAGASQQIGASNLIKMLMRAEYSMYSEDSGLIYNIFKGPTDTFGGNIFLVVEILSFFDQEMRAGSDKLTGYWRVEEMVSDLMGMGFQEAEISDAMDDLIEKKLLVCDRNEGGALSFTDLVKVSPSGYIQLRVLPHFVEYLSSVALHAPYRNRSVAKRIADVWGTRRSGRDLWYPGKVEVSETFAEYLDGEKRRLDEENPLFRERCRGADEIVRSVTQTVNTAPRPSTRTVRRKAAARTQVAGRRKGKRR